MNAVTLPITPVEPVENAVQPGAALSAQELAIESGRRTLHGNASDRVLRIFDAIRAYGSPRVTIDRAVYFTESFKATEGQPLVLRWAKALKHVAENIPVTIFDDELAGRPAEYLARPLWPRVRRARRQPAHGSGRGRLETAGTEGRGRRSRTRTGAPSRTCCTRTGTARTSARPSCARCPRRRGSSSSVRIAAMPPTPPASACARPSGGIRRTGPTTSPRSLTRAAPASGPRPRRDSPRSTTRATWSRRSRSSRPSSSPAMR